METVSPNPLHTPTSVDFSVIVFTVPTIIVKTVLTGEVMEMEVTDVTAGVITLSGVFAVKRFRK